MKDTLRKAYWDERFQDEGQIWGSLPSQTAEYALKIFLRENVKDVFVPGSGYGRNTKLFSTSGLNVTGAEISSVACQLAEEFDPLTKHFNNSVLDMRLDNNKHDAIYCYNVLHLFRRKERRLFLKKCNNIVNDNGLIFFTVFSEQDPSFGKGAEVEKNTFESRPDRPVHYYTEDNLLDEFKDFETLETGIFEDPEDHGEGPHTHMLWYILARKLPQIMD